ncbi:MAG TPA: GGDEF domain-containing protein [Dehalococcoidia bacterium]|nr:GGDEF domain-containing protein [Dehalococcoidia bacterium]
MFRVLNFAARTPSGVPVSDPFAEVRVLKMWTRVGVYTIIILFGAVDYYLIGLDFWQTMYVRFASLAVATGAIEIIFRQSLKLRKRSAYPARVLVDSGAAATVSTAGDVLAETLTGLLNVRAIAVTLGRPAEATYLTLRGWPEGVKQPLIECLNAQALVCYESQEAVVLPATTGMIEEGICESREVVALVPIVAFDQTLGVVIAAGDEHQQDLRDAELLRGVGNAFGVALDSLRQREEIQAKEERLRAVVTAAPVAIFLLDASGVFTLLEGRALERLSIQPGEIVGRSVYEVMPQSANVEEPFTRALEGETVRTVVELGETSLEVELGPLRDADGRVTTVIGVATDVTERKRAEDMIRHLAFHDSLTGLANRELFERTLTEALAEAKEHGHPLAVLFVDLDGFKQVNDTYGHSEGDALLKAVARRLNELIREGDFVARIGGDEFLVLLPAMKDQAEAVAVSDRLLVGLNADWQANGRTFRLGASIGVALYPQDGEDGSELMRSADKAMYAAKSRGKGCYATAAH